MNPDSERDAGADERAPSGFDLRETVVLGLGRVRWLALGLVSAGVLGGLVLGAAQPNVYQSQAKLLLRLGQREQMTPEVIVSGPSQPDSRPTMQDEIHLLRDPQIHARVVQSIGAKRILEPMDPRRFDGPNTPFYVRWLHEFQAFVQGFSAESAAGFEVGDRPAERQLANSTQLYTDRMSNVIAVVYTADDPAKANHVVTELVAAYIQRHREQFSIQKYLEESQSQLTASQAKRDAALKHWDDHVKGCGLVDLPTQRTSLLSNLSTVDGQLSQARTRRLEIEQQVKVLKALRTSIAPEIEQVTPAVLIENPEYTLAIERKRSALTARAALASSGLPLDEQRRRERDYDGEIERVNRELESLPPRIEGTPASRQKVPNTAWVQNETQLRGLELEDQGLAVRIVELERELAAKRGELKAMNECESAHIAMAASTEEAKRRYTDLFERYSKLLALSEIDVDEATNLRVLQPPSFEPDKVGPGRAKLLFVGALLGTIAALAAAMFVSFRDRRLRHPRTLERQLGVPVVCTVPEIGDLARAPAPAAAAKVERPLVRSQEALR